MTAPMKVYTQGDWYYPVASRPKIKAPRKKIRLAHIDTGFAWHPCVDGAFIEAHAMNFFCELNDKNKQGVRALWPPEELRKLGYLFRDHGLATGAFIIGHPSTSLNLPLHGMISEAESNFIEFIPMRVVESVDIGSADCERLAHAIDWAIDNNCHVISMSFGSLTVGAVLDANVNKLRPAFERARNNGVILCCASGQGPPFMVYPGQFSLEGLCITCGPSTKAKTPDSVSTIKPCWSVFPDGYVTICAPGAQMPKAYWFATSIFSSKYQPALTESEGSSYSTAFVASIAALWLAHHEDAIEQIKSRGKTHEIMENFKLAIQRTATSFDSLPIGITEKNVGPGIINPYLLLGGEPGTFIPRVRGRGNAVSQ